MADKLVDDCFAQPGRRLGHAEALSALASRIGPIAGIERVALVDALGRTLAAAVHAPHAVPNHTNAAVDGYSFAAADYRRDTGAELAIAGRSAAGDPLATLPPAGSAVRIFTGAVMPASHDTVAMQEDCEATEDAGGPPRVRIPPGLKAGANVRKAGEDVGLGALMRDAGDIVRPQDLAALASVGKAEVDCYARLRVGIVSTGDEVIRAGAAELPLGRVYDANAPMLQGLSALAGTAAADLGVWPDDPAVVEQRLAAAARDHDVVLTSGGASRGEEDHIAAALARLGSRHFWQIEVKPGRPMMFGQIGRTIVVGLPGNPVAVFVCFLMYVWPLLRRLGGAPWREPRRITLPAAFAFEGRKPGRREFWRGTIVGRPGGLAVRKFERDGSGLISSLRAADCLIDIPEAAGDVAEGDPVSVILLTEFGITSG